MISKKNWKSFKELFVEDFMKQLDKELKSNDDYNEWDAIGMGDELQNSSDINEFVEIVVEHTGKTETEITTYIISKLIKKC